MVTETANGRDGARIRRQRDKELYYFDLSFIIFVNSAINACVSLSPFVIKLAWAVRVNRASVYSNGSRVKMCQHKGKLLKA